MASSAIAVAQTSQAIRDGLLVSQLDRNMVLPKRQESRHESATWSLVGADNVRHAAGCSAGRWPLGRASGTCEAGWFRGSGCGEPALPRPVVRRPVQLLILR